MNEILLYLSIKYSGKWMAIYDSLQNREKLSVRDVKKTIDEVNCKFITLIDSKYCQNLKTIYKPPFGIFCYGNYDLLNQSIATVFGDEISQDWNETLMNNGINPLWVNLTNKQMISILNKHRSNNIFYFPEIRNVNNKIYQNILCDENIIGNNAFISEIWERKNEINYDDQLQERLYMGLTKRVFIFTKLKNKQLLSIAQYAKSENIDIFFSDNVIDRKQILLFNNKIKVFKDIRELDKYLKNKNN